MRWIYGNDSDFLLPGLGGGFIFFYFCPELGRWSNLTNIFQMGWNQQPDIQDHSFLDHHTHATWSRKMSLSLLRAWSVTAVSHRYGFWEVGCYGENFSKDAKFASTYPIILTAISIITATICFMTPQKKKQMACCCKRCKEPLREQLKKPPSPRESGHQAVSIQSWPSHAHGTGKSPFSRHMNTEYIIYVHIHITHCGFSSQRCWFTRH